jgi:hypothetical protein
MFQSLLYEEAKRRRGEEAKGPRAKGKGMKERKGEDERRRKATEMLQCLKSICR